MQTPPSAWKGWAFISSVTQEILVSGSCEMNKGSQRLWRKEVLLLGARRKNIRF